MLAQETRCEQSSRPAQEGISALGAVRVGFNGDKLSEGADSQAH